MNNASTGVHNVVVGVGDLQIADGADQRLITFALGSCIGITAWDPQLRVGGLLHFMLPQPVDRRQVPVNRMFNYATTGIPALFAKLEALGCATSDLIVCAAGAAEVLNDTGVFAVGKRNRTMMRKLLGNAEVVLAGEDTGGNRARTMSLHVGTGVVSLRTAAKDAVLWSNQE